MHRTLAVTAIVFGSVLVVLATSNREYGANEYDTVVRGTSPDGRYEIATHGEGYLGYDNFHLYLVDHKARNSLITLNEPVEPFVDTGADAYYADWSPDSKQVSITFRAERHVAVKVTYRIRDGRPIQVGGRHRVRGLPPD